MTRVLAQSVSGNVRSASVEADSIPVELRKLRRWVSWIPEPRRSGKPAKVPISPRTGRRADITEASQLVNFDEALAFSISARHSGVGFAFFACDPYAGIDLDNCREPSTGTLEPPAAVLIGDLDTYTEVSPSQTGVKAILRGKLQPHGRKRSCGIELYDRDRYFALTGHRLPCSPSTIEPRESVLHRLQSSITPITPCSPFSAGRIASGEGFSGTDAQLIEAAFGAKNGAKVKAAYNGRHDKATFSEGLLSLARLLAFWTGNNPDRLERLILTSPLFAFSEAERRKWHCRRSGGSWGTRFIIEKAISSCPEFIRSSTSLKNSHPCVRLGLQGALRAAKAGPRPAGLDSLVMRYEQRTESLRRFATFAWHLAGRAEGRRFFIPVERVGKALGVNPSTISRWLSQLVRQGVVKRLSRGSSYTGRASEYEWRGFDSMASAGVRMVTSTACSRTRVK